MIQKTGALVAAACFTNTSTIPIFNVTCIEDESVCSASLNPDFSVTTASDAAAHILVLEAVF